MAQPNAYTPTPPHKSKDRKAWKEAQRRNRRALKQKRRRGGTA